MENVFVFVVLVDGTVGEVVSGIAEEGQEVTVELHDENGNTIEKTGIVKYEL